MLRGKLYSVGLLIYCLLVMPGNIQKGPGTGTKRVAGIDPIFPHTPVFTLPNFDLNQTALQFAREYVEKNSWGLEKLKRRSQSRFTIINSVFSKYNIPSQLKYMAVVESNLNTDTVCSSTGATGIWQLMPVTACELGLKITDSCDERLHVYKSSRAVAKYLKQLYAQFGDWLLVVAAYNSGPAKVTRAIRLSNSHDFWKLQNLLPLETSNHVKRYMSVLHFFEGQNIAAILK
jgi:membrane-bound lytic murein transglycosylase D